MELRFCPDRVFDQGHLSGAIFGWEHFVWGRF